MTTDFKVVDFFVRNDNTPTSGNALARGCDCSGNSLTKLLKRNGAPESLVTRGILRYEAIKTGREFHYWLNPLPRGIKKVMREYFYPPTSVRADGNSDGARFRASMLHDPRRKTDFLVSKYSSPLFTPEGFVWVAGFGLAKWYLNLDVHLHDELHGLLEHFYDPKVATRLERSHRVPAVDLAFLRLLASEVRKREEGDLIRPTRGSTTTPHPDQLVEWAAVVFTHLNKQGSRPMPIMTQEMFESLAKICRLTPSMLTYLTADERLVGDAGFLCDLDDLRAGLENARSKPGSGYMLMRTMQRQFSLYMLGLAQRSLGHDVLFESSIVNDALARRIGLKGVDETAHWIDGCIAELLWTKDKPPTMKPL
jgi:hypothetical protein